MTLSKLTRVLEENLGRKADDEPIDIVIELNAAPDPRPAAGQSREERTNAAREAFKAIAAPVEQRIQSVGGEVLGQAWINQTLRARVPAGKVKEIVDAEGIASIDLPEQLTRD